MVRGHQGLLMVPSEDLQSTGSIPLHPTDLPRFQTLCLRVTLVVTLLLVTGAVTLVWGVSNSGRITEKI